MNNDRSAELKKDPLFRISLYIFLMTTMLMVAFVLFAVSSDFKLTTGLGIAMLCVLMADFIGINIVIVIVAGKYKYDTENDINYLKAYTCKYPYFNGLVKSEKLVGSFSGLEERKSSKKMEIIANIVQIVCSAIITIVLIAFLYINRKKLTDFSLENIEFIIRIGGLLIILGITVWLPFIFKGKGFKVEETMIDRLYSCLDNQDGIDIHDKRLFNKRLFCEFEYNDVLAFAMVSDTVIKIYAFEGRKIDDLKEIWNVSHSTGEDAMNSKIYKFFSGICERAKDVEHDSENYVIDEIKKIIEDYKKIDKKEVKGSYFSSMMEERYK